MPLNRVADGSNIRACAMAVAAPAAVVSGVRAKVFPPPTEWNPGHPAPIAPLATPLTVEIVLLDEQEKCIPCLQRKNTRSQVQFELEPHLRMDFQAASCNAPITGYTDNSEQQTALLFAQVWSTVSGGIKDLDLRALGSIPWQIYFQRVLSASSPNEGRLISYLSGLGCFIMAIPSVVIGAVAASTDWNQTAYGLPSPNDRGESALILPLVLYHLCPTYIALGGLGALAAAVMSSGDSALLSAGTLFAHNIYRKVFRKDASEEEVLWAMRMSMVIFGMMSAGLAFHAHSIYDLWFLSGELVYALLFPQLCCVLFIRNTNTYGSAAGFFLGLLLRLLAGEPTLNLPPVIHYPGCSLVDGAYVQLFPFKLFTMLVSLLTIVSVSHLSAFLFKANVLPRRWDVCKIMRADRVVISLPQRRKRDACARTEF